jgi:hypothetical protein
MASAHVRWPHFLGSYRNELSIRVESVEAGVTVARCRQLSLVHCRATRSTWLVKMTRGVELELSCPPPCAARATQLTFSLGEALTTPTFDSSITHAAMNANRFRSCSLLAPFDRGDTPTSRKLRE